MGVKLGFFIIICLLISVILSVLNFILVPVAYTVDKTAIYECGFDPISDAREKLEIRYYLFAILFIVFDMELMFIWPWVLSLSFVGFISYVFMIFFLLVLTVGFLFEWSQGALEWR